MTTTKVTHTPGPWLVQRGEECCFHDGNGFAITQAGTDEQGESWDQTIAEVWPANNGQDEADAYLIAAAPEMLAFIEKQYGATNCICSGPIGRVQAMLGTSVPCAKCEAEGLIQKARGGQ